MSAQGDGPKGTVHYQGEHVTLEFETWLAHPPEAVWEAITDPLHLSGWYMVTAAIDGRKGGSVEFNAGHAGLHITGRILEWDRPRVFAYEWKIKPMPRSPRGEDAVVRWQLDPGRGGTLLTLTHRNVTRRLAVGVTPATHVLLERLVAFLDGREMPDMQKRFTEVVEIYRAHEG